MRMTGKVLVKGLSIRDGKEGKKYHNAELYGLEGRALDIQASVDMSNGTGQVLIQKLEKLKFQPAQVVLDYTVWEGRGRFGLVDIEAVKG